MSEKKIPTIQWQPEGCEENPQVWRMDEPGSAEQFFQVLMDNAEMDSSDIITLKKMTEAEWAECERIGAELA
jgi:predicted aldo/keto reductase-like oxidoreductase